MPYVGSAGLDHCLLRLTLRIMSTLVKADSIVRKISLHKKRPWFFHWTVFPFVSAYIAFAAVFLSPSIQNELVKTVFGGDNGAVDQETVGDSAHENVPEVIDAGDIPFSLLQVTMALLLTVFLHILLFLLSHWKVGVRCFVQFETLSLSKLEMVTTVRIVPRLHKGSEELSPLYTDEEGSWFSFQRRKYILDHEKGVFGKLSYPTDWTPAQYLRGAGGLMKDADVEVAKRKYGENMIAVPIPPFGELFKEHALAPFFVFQVFSVSLWCLDEMWFYSIVTLVMLVFMEVLLVKQRLRNMQELRKTVEASPHQVFVLRGRKWAKIGTNEIVPRDIISVARGAKPVVCPCDAVLLAGTAIVNEAVLTGESVPQMKEAIAARGEDTVLTSEHPLDLRRDRRHCLFAGTMIAQHEGAKMEPCDDNRKSYPRPPDGGCVCCVLTTGFGTTQGKLVRTILYSAERVTASTKETGLFLLFLLVFALAAAAYVMDRGLKEGRSPWKLVLMCAQIVTSVVPPELPIELSLAVNQSLIALGKMAVFCTEPFRIPFAGKVSACCFDKTGTLTSDELVLRGVIGGPKNELILPDHLSEDVLCGIAGCHSLSFVGDGGKDSMVGDPMERAALDAIGFHVSKSSITVSRRSPKRVIRIVKHHHFSSALRRMSTVCVLEHLGTNNEHALCCVKGAPEAVAPLLASVPEGYAQLHEDQAAQGFRVLALASKSILGRSAPALRGMERSEVESGLTFLGFLVYHCPLKHDAILTISSLAPSCKLVIITGDHMLAAISVARTLELSKCPVLIADAAWSKSATEFAVRWKALPGDPLGRRDGGEGVQTVEALANTHDLCVPGHVLDAVSQSPEAQNTPGDAPPEEMTAVEVRHEGAIVTVAGPLTAILPHVRVFARASPQHKELIVASLKSAKDITLMCGDGTNDAGALGQADVGVALLANAPQEKPKSTAAGHGKAAETTARRRPEREHHSRSVPRRSKNKPKPKGGMAGLMQSMKDAKAQLAQKPSEDQPPPMAEEQPPSLKPGDACVAAPFTSKNGELSSVLEIVRQGRCTLATTLQMYRILCVNCLISAYSLSVMYLDGLKMGDFQMGAAGIILAACFFFISRAKPAPLSSSRPRPNIFSVAMLISITGQFAVHLVIMIWTQQYATSFSPQSELDAPVDIDADFSPTLVNTAVFLISLSMQLATFVVNYAGRPHMEDLSENRPLMYSLIAVALSVIFLSAQVISPLNVWLEFVPMPTDFMFRLLGLEVVDFLAVFVWQKILRRWL